MSRSPDNRRDWPARPPRAFTLIETILVLAVITLLGTLLLPGVNSILKTINQEEPDRLFWDTVTAARELALTTNRTVELRLTADKKTLVWGDTGTQRQQKMPAGFSLGFLRPKQGSTILLGGVLLEADEIFTVRFYADGSCDRFRVQIMRDKLPPQILQVDPWTCAPLVGLDR